MSVKLSYCTLVGMNYYDYMTFLSSEYNISDVMADRIGSIATTDNVTHLIKNNEDVFHLCNFMESVVEKCVRKSLVGLFENVSVVCDHLHEQPFNCFFPYTVGLSRNVVTQINFKTNNDLNLFKLHYPELYSSLVKRCER